MGLILRLECFPHFSSWSRHCRFPFLVTPFPFLLLPPVLSAAFPLRQTTTAPTANCRRRGDPLAPPRLRRPPRGEGSYLDPALWAACVFPI